MPQKYKYELEALEIEINQLEKQLEATGEGMEVNSSDVKKLNQLYLENESLNNALEQAYARWEELSILMGES